VDGTERGTAWGRREARKAGRGRMSRMRAWGSERKSGKSVGLTAVKRAAKGEGAGK
jgi:hypothetical protein